MNDTTKEITTIILAIIILALTITIYTSTDFLHALTIFAILISANVLTKKAISNHFESNIRIKFWEWYSFWFRKDSHFKKPVPMVWLPPALAFITQGAFWWLQILEFDIQPKPERAAKRHGLYRFTEVTEWHIAWIAFFGILANLTLAIIGYVAGFETFARLNIFFALWSVIPLAGWDGNKILFGSRALWFTTLVITIIFFGYTLTTI